MKRIVGFLIVGIVGGLIGASVFFITASDGNQTESNQPIIPQSTYTVPAHYTNLTASTSSGQLFPDFTNAAELTMNAVVHIRTENTQEKLGLRSLLFRFS
jgi:hypothetical protein